MTVNCVHPGWVRTNFGRQNQPLAWRLMIAVVLPFMRSPEQGAETAVYLASDPELETVTGKYFHDLKPKRSSKLSYDEACGRATLAGGRGVHRSASDRLGRRASGLSRRVEIFGHRRLGSTADGSDLGAVEDMARTGLFAGPRPGRLTRPAASSEVRSWLRDDQIDGDGGSGNFWTVA